MEPALVPTSSRRSVRSARLGTDGAQSKPPVRGTVQRMWRLVGIIRLIPFRDPDTSPNRAVVCILRPDLQPLQGFLAEPQLEPGTASGFCGVRYATNLTKEKPRICGALIGAPGFEPGTSPTRTVRATRLRHAPIEPVSHKAHGGSWRWASWSWRPEPVRRSRLSDSRRRELGAAEVGLVHQALDGVDDLGADVADLRQSRGTNVGHLLNGRPRGVLGARHSGTHGARQP